MPGLSDYVVLYGPVVPRTLREQLNVRVEPDILEGLHQVRVVEGIPVSEQVRRALRAWLDDRAVVVKKKTDRRSARTPRRS